MKRRLLIPIFIMILTFSTVLASWIIINQKDSYLESEYFPFEVSSEQTKIFNGQNQSIDIDFDDLNVTLDQSNLTVEYYKVTEVKNNGKTEYVLGNKMATSPRNQGTYYVKILAELTNDAGETVTEEVKFVIARRCVKVIPASYSAYFAQSLDYKTTDSNSLAGYTFVENEYFYENVTTTTGLLETHSITKTSNFG